MDGDNKPALVALHRRRDQVIEQLSESFAGDAIGLDEFEARLDRAHSATSLAVLDELVADLVTDLAPVTAGASDRALARPEPSPGAVQAIERAREQTKTTVTLIGGVERKGAWHVPRSERIYALIGGAELDFREAILPPGVTEIRLAAVLGGAEIIVPPDLPVECDGWALLGGFENMSRAPVVPDPTKPLLKITGYCLIGGVEVETRLVGETARDARRRRRRERKALKKQRKLAAREAKRLPDSTE